jgi:hypothetical protein
VSGIGRLACPRGDQQTDACNNPGSDQVMGGRHRPWLVPAKTMSEVGQGGWVEVEDWEGRTSKRAWIPLPCVWRSPSRRREVQPRSRGHCSSRMRSPKFRLFRFLCNARTFSVQLHRNGYIPLRLGSRYLAFLFPYILDIRRSFCLHMPGSQPLGFPLYLMLWITNSRGL